MSCLSERRACYYSCCLFSDSLQRGLDLQLHASLARSLAPWFKPHQVLCEASASADAMFRSIPSKRAPPAQCHPPAQMPCSGPCQACEHPPAQYCTIRQRRCHVQVHAKQASTPVRSTSASFSQLHKQILQGLLLDALEGLEVQWPPIATFARHRLGGVNLLAAAHRPA